MTPAAALDELEAVMAEELEHIRALQDLARRQRHALVASDYAAIGRTAAAMEDLVAVLDGCAARRGAVLSASNVGSARLDDVLALAADAGQGELLRLGGELRSEVQVLLELQEQNAALVLNAEKLRERWLDMITRHTSPAYGPGNEDTGYRLLSRSA